MVWAAAAAPALANTNEQRDYVITVDGKEAGSSQMTVSVQADGTVVMTAKAAVRINRVVFSYSYDVQATEWWKNGRLVGVKSTANDNGKRTDITGSVEGTQLRVRVNAMERLVRGDVWVNSYWKLADARFHNAQVPVLDGDTGRDFNGQLQYVGPEQITVGGIGMKCFHFRVTGGPSSPVELWYDESHRLLRQEFVEQGHRTIVHATAIRR